MWRTTGAVKIWQLTRRQNVNKSVHTTKTKSFCAQNSPLIRLYPSYRHETKCKIDPRFSADWFHTTTNNLDASYDDYRPFSYTPLVDFQRLPPFWVWPDFALRMRAARGSVSRRSRRWGGVSKANRTNEVDKRDVVIAICQSWSGSRAGKTTGLRRQTMWCQN